MLKGSVWLVFFMSRNMNFAILSYDSPVFLNKDLRIEAFTLRCQLCVTKTETDTQFLCLFEKGSRNRRGHLGFVIVISV